MGCCGGGESQGRHESEEHWLMHVSIVLIVGGCGGQKAFAGGGMRVFI